MRTPPTWHTVERCDGPNHRQRRTGAPRWLVLLAAGAAVVTCLTLLAGCGGGRRRGPEEAAAATGQSLPENPAVSSLRMEPATRRSEGWANVKVIVPPGYTLTDVKYETGGGNVCATDYTKDPPKEVTAGTAEFCRRHNKSSLSGTNLRFLYKVNNTTPQVYLRGYVNNPYNDGGNQKSTVACDISDSDTLIAKTANNTAPTLTKQEEAPTAEVGCFATWPGQPGVAVGQKALATISLVRPTVIAASFSAIGTTHEDEATVDHLSPKLTPDNIYSVYGPDIPPDAILTISAGGESGTLSDLFGRSVKATGSTTGATLTLADKTDTDAALALMDKTCSFTVAGWVANKDALKALKAQPDGTAYVVGQDYGASPPKNGVIFVYSAEAGEWLDTRLPGTPPGAGCTAGSAQTHAHAGDQVLPAFLASPRLVGYTFCNSTQATETYTQQWTRTATVSNMWGVEGHVWASYTVGAKFEKLVSAGWQFTLGASIGARYERQWTRGEEFSVTVNLTLHPQEAGGVYVEPGNLVARADWLVANPPYNVPGNGQGGPGTLYLLKGFVMYLPIAQGETVNTKTPQGKVEMIPAKHFVTDSYKPQAGCSQVRQDKAGSPPPAGVALTPIDQ